MAELTASLGVTIANANAGADGHIARDAAAGNALYTTGEATSPGHHYSSGRGHSYYRAFLAFDTSGIDSAPLLEVADSPAFTINIFGYGSVQGDFITYKANLTSSTALLNTANFNDFDGWVSGSAFTGSVYGSFLTASLITSTDISNPAYQPITGTAELADAMQNNDFVSMVIVGHYHDAQYNADDETAGPRWLIDSTDGRPSGASPPKIIYTAGTTKSKILGISPAKQKSVSGVARDKATKVYDRR